MQWRTRDAQTTIDPRFHSLFLSHYDDVLGYCVRRTTFSEAEDAVSEVFAVAWRRIDELELNTAVPWLLGIARGVLSNQPRSASQRLRLTRKVASIGEGEVEDPDLNVFRREQDKECVDALEGLGETDSEILMLSTWEELSAPEIATALDISVSAAEQHLHDAKHRFAAALETVSPNVAPDITQEDGVASLTSINNALDRLRAANPAPDKRLLRAESDDLDDLLTATWQGNTNLQTQAPQESQQSEKLSRRGWRVVIAAFAVAAIFGLGTILIATNNDNVSAVGPAGRIAIEAELNVSTRPITGTFEVTEGAAVLGCSGGTFEDMPGVNGVNRAMTCSGPKTGTFTITFDPGGHDPGPGQLNGPWIVLDGYADFTGLQGGGDWSAVGTTETTTGDIEYSS